MHGINTGGRDLTLEDLGLILRGMDVPLTTG
jgi:hypothetical protein